MAKIVLVKTRRRKKNKKGKKKTQAQKDAEKLKRQEYHRQYYLTHQKNKSKNPGPARNKDGTERKRRAPGVSKRGSVEFKRQPTKTTYTVSDIMQAPTEKSLKMLQKICAGEKMLTT
jgi:hypothetical protein